MKPGVNFIVYTDLHVDIVHDAVARMEVLLADAVKHRMDFIVHLGDGMYPDADFLRAHAPESCEKLKDTWFVCDRDDEKRAIRKMITECGIPLYNVLGNHDMDACSKDTACRYSGMPGPHYAFDAGNVRFIALDTNFINDNGVLVDVDHCNYGKTFKVGWLPPAQLEWLERTVTESPYPCVLMSHAPIGDNLHNVQNADDVFDLIRRVNKDKRRIVMAMNGHSHIDGVVTREGVPFYDVNSISNLWLGSKYATIRYSETIDKIYPHLKHTAPYWDALFARVTIDADGIRISGRASSFVGPSPQELGFPPDGSFHPPSASIVDRVLPL